MIREFLKPLVILAGLLSTAFVLVVLNMQNVRNWLSPNHIYIQTFDDINLSEVMLKWTAEGSEDTLIIFVNRRMTITEFKEKGFNQFLIFSYHFNLIPSLRSVIRSFLYNPPIAFLNTFLLRPKTIFIILASLLS